MKLRFKFARVAAVLFSLALLISYVVYSHITPNTPPPDPFGLSGIDLSLEPEVIEFDSFSDYGTPMLSRKNSGDDPRIYGTPLPSQKNSGDDLRIITSKSISQPIFSTKSRGEDQTLPKADKAPSFWARLFRSTPVKKQRADSAGHDKDLRIISSKVINQPIFSARVVTMAFGDYDGPAFGDPYRLKPGPYTPPEQNRAAEWLPVIRMGGLLLDPLRSTASKPSP